MIFSGEQECQAIHELILEVQGNSLRLDASFNDRCLVTKISNNKYEKKHIINNVKKNNRTRTI